MLVTNDVLSGAFIGRVATGAVSAFGWGVLSHLVLDAVPHWGDERPIEELMSVAVRPSPVRQRFSQAVNAEVS
ncbi:MAG: hypothetical protein ACR2FG_00700 [Marmoricola sp.]